MTIKRARALFDWRRCLAHAENIWNEDRWSRNSAYLKTAAYCLNAMRDMGLAQVESLGLRADGRTAYGEWVMPRAWEARAACLRLGGKGGQTLADYERAPCCLSMYSAATPPEGVTAELIDASRAELDESARGKLLFTHSPAKTLITPALKYGALGIITDYFPLYPGIRDSRADMAGACRWDNDFMTPANASGLFAFNLSPENGDMLSGMLASGQTVELYAHVDAEAFDGALPTVSGAIPGYDAGAGEILLYAHLYEQGANDNASGCAILLETANILADAIRAGALNAPRRTIRIAMGQECAGSVGYLLNHTERDARLCIVADMVGCEAKDRARLGIWHNPMSNWSFLDGFIEALAKDAAREAPFEWESRAFSIGTDNMLGDPAFNMPTVALVSEPALSYHTSLDTPDRLEEGVMRRNASILLAALGALANAKESDFEAMRASSGDYAQYMRRASANPARRALWDSIIADTRRELSAYCAGKRAPRRVSIPVNASRHPGAARVPARLIKGCLCFARRDAGGKHTLQPAWNTKLHLPLFWADGKRTLWEIACLYAAEIGADDVDGVYQYIEACFQALAESNAVGWI